MKHAPARPWTYAIATCKAQTHGSSKGRESAMSRRLHQSLVFRLRFRVRAWRHRAQARREIAQMTGHKNRP